jgi:glycosyltransferase involved in cell wall biosynthesis
MEVIPYHRSPARLKRLKQLVNVIGGKSDILNEPGTKALLNALDLLFVHDHYDAVLFEGTLNSNYHLPEQVKVIIDKHNIEFELLERLSLNETRWFRKWYNGREYRLVKPVEIKQCRDADAVAVTSERERLLLKRLLPHNVIEVVPNGVDVAYFHGSGAEQEVDGRIVFTGAMDYYPNAEAALFFAQKCWPLIRARMPGATWQIVGKNPRPDVQKLAVLPGITVTGSVADVRPSFAEAEVAIVPLLLGGGTRLKILEAMAMRKAVVSTSLGCEGLSAVPGKHLIVADQPEVFAQAVIELLKNPEKRRALGTAGRALVESAYSWERCGDRLLHILEQMK